MFRSLIVDDEPHCRDWVKRQLLPIPDIVVVGEAGSVEEAAIQNDRLKPDLLFLDIQLGDGTGFDLLRRGVVNAHVIFLTAYGEHAIEAFSVDATDYLLKPVHPERLQEAVDRARLRPIPARTLGVSRLRLHDRVLMANGRGPRRVAVADIAYISGAVDYSEAHLVDGAMFILRRSLRQWEEELPAPFTRVHRSTIVNLGLVEALHERGRSFSLRLREGNIELAVSRRRAAEVAKRLKA
ncbi:MAG: LytTR family DNA-binding domain-containing protein [Myxococcota bacterium]